MHVSRRGASVALAAVAVGTAAVAGPVATAAPKTAWAATSTRAVSLVGTKLGALPSSHRLTLSIALTPRNAAAESAAMRAIYTHGSGSYHHYLTSSEWRASYAPSTATVERVTSYLKAQGFTGLHVAGDRLLVTAHASTAEVEHAFDTSISRVRLLDKGAFAGRTMFANTAPAMVPASLSGVVTAVIGLDNLPLSLDKPIQAQAPQAKAGSPSINGLTPQGFETTYNAVGTPTGKKTKIAILSEGAIKPVIASLRYAESKEGEKKAKVSVVNVGAQTTDTSGADEFDMDSQESTGVSGGVKHLYFYNIGSLIDADVVADFTKYVSQNKAKALSASIGGCELNSYLDGSEATVDTLMMQGAMQGQSLFASSGDNGDACMYVAAVGAPAGVPGVNWPAAGRYDTAVGGTSLVTDAKGNRIKELAWVGSGGGVSDVETPGFWTLDSDPANAAQLASAGRAVPDVALDADPNVATPAIVYVGTTVDYVGGTSLSSPMMLGFWARLESTHKNKLGLASIPLYQLYDKVNPGSVKTVAGKTEHTPSAMPKAVKGFTDITLGDNGVYPALPGYDEATGLGAPNVKVLDKVIK